MSPGAERLSLRARETGMKAPGAGEIRPGIYRFIPRLEALWKIG